MPLKLLLKKIDDTVSIRIRKRTLRLQREHISRGLRYAMDHLLDLHGRVTSMGSSQFSERQRKLLVDTQKESAALARYIQILRRSTITSYYDEIRLQELSYDQKMECLSMNKIERLKLAREEIARQNAVIQEIKDGCPCEYVSEVYERSEKYEKTPKIRCRVCDSVREPTLTEKRRMITEVIMREGDVLFQHDAPPPINDEIINKYMNGYNVMEMSNDVMRLWEKAIPEHHKTFFTKRAMDSLRDFDEYAAKNPVDK